jgi:hypothetical protein
MPTTALETVLTALGPHYEPPKSGLTPAPGFLHSLHPQQTYAASTGTAWFGWSWPKAEWQPVDAGAQIPAIRRKQFVTFDRAQEQHRSNERAKAWNGGAW